MKPLVSIVAPCYNGEKKVKFFLESILNQTYDNIEFIIVNDGSTDKTEEILLSYEKFFKKRGYKFIYLKQDNSGPDVALNNGLKYFSGDYLMWPDSDDILDKDNVEEKVNYLENNQDISLVYCDASIVKEENKKKPIKYWRKSLKKNKREFFEDVISANNIVYAGGAWMLRAQSFLSIKPDRNIEIEGFGQNWQMLLPMIYNFNIGKIEKNLFTYIVYKDSHSNKKKLYKEECNYIKKQKTGLFHILNNIKMLDEEEKYYHNFVENLIEYRLMCLAIQGNNKKDFYLKYNVLNNRKYIFNLKDKIKIILFKMNMYNFFRKIKSILRN